MDIGTLFDPNSIVADLGLIGILAILFAETGLLVGLAFPGDSLLFIAGLAASGSAAALLGGVQLSPLALFIGAPLPQSQARNLGTSSALNMGANYLIVKTAASLPKPESCRPKSGWVNMGLAKQLFWPASFHLFAP